MIFNGVELNFSLSNERIKELNNLELNYNFGNRTKNLTGQKFNKLTVLGKGPDYVSPRGQHASQWWCICDCDEHNILLVRHTNLTQNNTKSCGCLDREGRTKRIIEAGRRCAVDITNKKVGLLTALYPTEERNNGSVVWVCRCDCGRTHKVSAKDFNDNRIYSCGCLKESKGVFQIKKILNENNIEYETEKTFKTCVFPDTQASARFDFYLPAYNLLIEYDGEQHFFERDLNFFRDSLEKRQAHDQFKTNWCIENNIKLIRIPYTQLKNISIEMLLGETI